MEEGVVAPPSPPRKPKYLYIDYYPPKTIFILINNI